MSASDLAERANPGRLVFFAERFVLLGVADAFGGTILGDAGRSSLGGIMTIQDNQVSVDEKTRKGALSRRLEDFGWGALLIAIGTIWLVPEKQVPPGSWLIAAGVIMLGLNVIRYFNGISMSGFSLVVGTLALFAGVGEFFGLNLPLLAVALIVIGACMILKPLLEKGSTSPNAQGWCCCGPRDQDLNQVRARGQAVGH